MLMHPGTWYSLSDVSVSDDFPIQTLKQVVLAVFVPPTQLLLKDVLLMQTQ